jgi:hypothetical protein
VPNEVLRDHCRTYKNVGVGYYPNSLFVHFDTRAKSTFWVDLSKPGEAPKYLTPGSDVDHGVDDTSVEGTDLTAKEPGDSPAVATSATVATTPVSPSAAPSDKGAEKPAEKPAPAPAGSTGQK